MGTPSTGFPIRTYALAGFRSRSAIGGLFFPRGPAAVSRLVVSVIIFSVEGMSRRRLTAKFSRKLAEIIKEEFDSSCAVPFIVAEFWINTSLLSIKKCLVFGSFVSTACIPMLKLTRRASRDGCARSLSLREKVTSQSGSHLTAIALATPDDHVPILFSERSVACWPQHCQMAKALSGQIRKHGKSLFVWLERPQLAIQ